MKPRHKYTRRTKAPDNKQMAYGVLLTKRCVTCGMVFSEHFSRKGKRPDTYYERNGRIFLELPECIDWDAEGETID